MKRSLRILVADDDRDNADSLGELFELEGHRPMVTHDGLGAIAAYQSENFDLAFMDVTMPGKTGVESFFEIRNLRPEAKAYLMTGFSVEQLLQQAMAGSAFGLFQKPVNLYRVMEAVTGIGEAGIILVCDDDPGIAEGLQQIINREGMRCALALTSGQAMKIAAGRRIDVLVLDLQLPLIQAIDLFAQMRKLKIGMPTVIVTRSLSVDFRRAAAMSNLAVTGVLSKPFDPVSLMARLDGLVA